MGYYKHYYRSYCDPYCYRLPYRAYYDFLLYESIREQNRYKDLYFNKLYDVDPCNPYYSKMIGCKL